MKARFFRKWSSRLHRNSSNIITSTIFGVAFTGGTIWLTAAAYYGEYYAASFSFALALIIAVTSYRFARRAIVIGRMVSALLGIYIALIIVFGSAHYVLFLTQPERYSFSSSIKEGKVLANYEDDYIGVLDRNKALYVLAIAHEKLEKVSEAQRLKVILTNPSRATIETEEGFVSLDRTSKIRFRIDQLLGSNFTMLLYFIDVHYKDFFSLLVVIRGAAY